MLYSDKGVFLVKGIFYETSSTRKKHKPLWSLKVEPHVVNGEEYPSAYQAYMNATDEYEAAHELVGNLKNWERLCRCDWFMNGSTFTGHIGLNAWRKHMLRRDMSTAKRALLTEAKTGSVSAARGLMALHASQTKAPKVKEKPGEEKTPENEKVDRLVDAFKQRED